MSLKKELFHSSQTLDFLSFGTSSYEMILSLMVLTLHQVEIKLVGTKYG